jgi:hypothetical protein
MWSNSNQIQPKYAAFFNSCLSTTFGYISGYDAPPGIQESFIAGHRRKVPRCKHREPDDRDETSPDCNYTNEAVFAGK